MKVLHNFIGGLLVALLLPALCRGAQQSIRVVMGE